MIGLKEGQRLHHVLRDAAWKLEPFRAIRLPLIREPIGSRPISLCLDETGAVKKGAAIAYSEWLGWTSSASS
jgi:SRSO17 transposase